MKKADVEKEVKAKHGLKVIWDDYCIGARVKDTIYLNPNLLNHPRHLKNVLDHELRHSGKMSFDDFYMDLVEGSFFDTLFFSLEYPKTLRRFFPFYYNHGLQVDVNLLIIYAIMVLLFSIILYAA